MPIDPSILLSSTPIKYPDLVEQRAKALQLQSLTQQNQLGQQQLQEGDLKLQQQQEINAAYRNAYKSDPTTGKVSLDADALTKALATSGHAATAIPGIVDSLAKAQEAKNTVIEGTQKIQTAADDHLAFTANAIIKAQGDPALAITQLQNEAASNKDPKILQAIQAIQQNPTPQTVQQVVTPFVQSSPGALKVLAEQQQADARKQQADLAEKRLKLETPGIQANNAVKSNQLKAMQFGAAGAAGYSPTPEDIAAGFPAKYDLGAILRAGLTPDQQVTTSQTAAQRAEQLRHNQVEEGQGRQRIGIEGQRADATTSLAASALGDREVAQFTKAHQANVTQGQSQLEKINEAQQMLQTGNAETQALAVPKVLSALVGGQGSGLRMTKNELDSISKARGLGGDFQGALSRLANGKTLTPTQTQQLQGALADVQKRIGQKVDISNQAIDQIQNAPDRASRIQADQDARGKLNTLGQPTVPYSAGGIKYNIPKDKVSAFLKDHPEAKQQ